MEKQVNRMDSFFKKAEFSYYGIMSMVVLIGSCWGSIAAMMIFKNNAPIWELALVIAGTMGANAAAIAQAPIKWLLSVAAGSAVVNTLLILVNIC